MAQENLNSANTWVYHCPPPSNPQGLHDFDYRIIWGNAGSLFIEARNNLIGIKFSANCWNSRDGWIGLNSQRMLAEPTSQSHTFSQVYLVTNFARMETQLYWGKRYKIESKLEIIYDNGEVISITNTNVDGCLKNMILIMRIYSIVLLKMSTVKKFNNTLQ